MKKARRVVAAMLVFVLTLAMSMTVFGDTKSGYLITVQNEESGHVYEAYQIFAGELSEDGTTLSNIQWGEGISAQGQEALGNAAEYAESLANGTVAAESAAQILAQYLTAPTGVADTNDYGEYSIMVTKAGYYLIKDAEGSQDGTGSAYTANILQVVKNVTITPKADVPSVSKWVKDINDSTDYELTDWQKSADYDLGDTVPFRLVATMPSNVADYASYRLVFHDTLSAGLTFTDEDAYTVMINGAAVTGFTKTIEANADGSKSITFACDDIKALGQEITANTTVEVEYSAVLNSEAVAGAAGNPNEVYLEFSNNPNASGEGDVGQTPEDKVVVFTYNVVINKVDGNNNPLAGAGFTLYKVLVDGTQLTIDRVEISEDQTSFSFGHIDDGVYILSETTTPNGYNSIPDVTFTVVANHGDQTITLDSLTATQTSEGDAILAFGGDVATGVLSSDVVNFSGAVLPSTGGAGTVLIYVVGIVLVLGAAIFLIARKRASK
ncbi:MAG: isopeptide-forming domain-containing fimbrial protein [Blautia sp.]|nr:isopeptide-forming domain-containing fimbrial protein [Blautia sp.]